MRSIAVIGALCFASVVLAKPGFGPGEQEWGYVEVREHAHMFWWLYFTTANVTSFYEKPLVIWLQGGPGASSTGYGNFEELGPIDVNQRPRNYTWVKDYNVLFIDNPVGAGFSYVTRMSAYTRTNEQIAIDLVACMKGFLEKIPEFANVPTYITTESYGGKMGAEFALLWYKEQKAGNIKSNLKGVALGDAWISPIDSVMTWAPFLLATGMIDTNGYKNVNEAALQTKQAIETGQWRTATSLWAYTERVIMSNTGNIDFYNILTKKHYQSLRNFSLKKGFVKPVAEAGQGVSYESEIEEQSLADLMNGPVKRKLGLEVTHGNQQGAVFSMLRADFMKPVIDKVELLLNETDLAVVVLSGQLDLIVDTPGTVEWVERLQWKHSEAWAKSDRVPLVSDGIIEGYVKVYRNLAMYWINRAGHMVPRDNPAGMAELLNQFIYKM